MPYAFDTIELPRRSKGRQSPEKAERYDADVERFCRQIIQINSTLDFKVSSRGWCYILEEHGLEKGDFDVTQRLINDCRKSGDLPLDICAEDEARLADNLERLDVDDPLQESTRAIEFIQEWHETYNPISFWGCQDYYVEMVVEKIDLKSLFSPICEEFHVPCTNSRGWSDINSRARMAERFKVWEEKGKIILSRSSKTISRSSENENVRLTRWSCGQRLVVNCVEMPSWSTSTSKKSKNTRRN